MTAVGQSRSFGIPLNRVCYAVVNRHPAPNVGELAKLFLTKHNVGFEIEMSQTKLEPATLAEHAGKYTVLISCWGG